jgi:transposase-like protein
MMNKTQRVRELLEQGKPVKEIAKEVGCDLSLVYTTRGAKRKYETASGRKLKRKKLTKVQLKRIDAEDEVACAEARAWAETATKNFFENEMVNSPSHYTVGGIETYDFIKAKGLSYELGNVVKYATRAKWKSNMLEDLKKARWYLDAAIKREEQG